MGRCYDALAWRMSTLSVQFRFTSPPPPHPSPLPFGDNGSILELTLNYEAQGKVRIVVLSCRILLHRDPGPGQCLNHRHQVTKVYALQLTPMTLYSVGGTHTAKWMGGVLGLLGSALQEAGKKIHRSPARSLWESLTCHIESALIVCLRAFIKGSLKTGEQSGTFVLRSMDPLVY